MLWIVEGHTDSDRGYGGQIKLERNFRTLILGIDIDIDV